MASTLVLRDDDLDRYMQEVKQHPLLDAEAEQALAYRYRDQHDLSAAHRLVVANLRFVVKIAHEYRNYGFKLLDLIQEGNIGLMTAVKKFDPERGYRLVTYAVWWIRAHIRDYILRSWSMVKMGTSRLRRKLFFKLRSERRLLEEQARLRGESLDSDELAQHMGVKPEMLAEMEGRLAARDFSLHSPFGYEDEATTHLDMLPDSTPDIEHRLGDHQEQEHLSQAVNETLASLNEKERHIVDHRLLSDSPSTLQEIGNHFGVSRERIRQLEERVLKTLRTQLRSKMTARSALSELGSGFGASQAACG